jgi:L-fuconolactonase
MIVDSHQHFWDLERVEYPWLVPAYGPIYRTFRPDELEPQLQAAGVDRTVLVQAADSLADTRAMLALADANDWIGAVVGWVPLDDPVAAARMLDEHLMGHPRFRGIRHLIHDEPDPDWVVQPAVMDGLRVLQARDLVFEVVAVYPLHLGHVPTIARACPDLRIVIDHLAKPPIASGDLGGWKRDIASAAAYPNVAAKISGLDTAADHATWTANDLVGPIGHAIDVFGVDRLMFGSDWPVTLLAGDYQRVWSATNHALGALGLTGPERAAILGGTAARIYAIEPAAS